MKYLLSGVAVIAALAFSMPVWSQPVNPSGGNSMGTPGPNPGGPGLTPYSGGAPAPRPAPPPSTAAPYSAPPQSSTYDNTSATPPSYPGHRHARHYHAKGHYHAGTYHRGKGYALSGSTANQLNQEELARLQAGNYSNPSAPSYSGSPPPGKGYPGGSAPPSYQPPMGTTGGGAPYRP